VKIAEQCYDMNIVEICQGVKIVETRHGTSPQTKQPKPYSHPQPDQPIANEKQLKIF